MKDPCQIHMGKNSDAISVPRPWCPAQDSSTSTVCGVVSHMHTVAGVLPAHTRTHPWIESCAHSARKAVWEKGWRSTAAYQTRPSQPGSRPSTQGAPARPVRKTFAGRVGAQPRKPDVHKLHTPARPATNPQPATNLAQPQQTRSVLVPSHAPCTNKLQST